MKCREQGYALLNEKCSQNRNSNHFKETLESVWIRIRCKCNAHIEYESLEKFNLAGFLFPK